MSVFGNWTVGKRLVAGFGLSALTLLMVAAVSYYNINRLIEKFASPGSLIESLQTRRQVPEQGCLFRPAWRQHC